jgi:hypothetical protein
MSTVPTALLSKPARLWSEEEKQAYGEDYARQIGEARATLLQLLDSPDFYTPEVQQQMQAIMAKFGMQKGQAQPSVPQSQQAASADASVPQPSSKTADSSGGVLGWLSGLFRRPTSDGHAFSSVMEQQVEPQCAEGQKTHVVAH